MKQFYGIFLLVCLCVPVAGTYSWLQCQKLRIKHEVKQALLQGIHQERLVRLAFTPLQVDTLLRWEHAREFEYQGQMYDVLKQEQYPDSLVYWCWWDQEETLVNKWLYALIKKALDQDPESQDAEDELSEFFELLYCSGPPNPFIFQQNKYRFFAKRVHAEILTLYASLVFEPPSPPPKQV